MNIARKCSCGKEFVLTIPEGIDDRLKQLLVKLADCVRCNRCSAFLWDSGQAQAKIMRCAHAITCLRLLGHEDGKEIERLRRTVAALLRCWDKYHRSTLLQVPNMVNSMTETLAADPAQAAGVLAHFKRNWQGLQRPAQMESAATGNE